MNIKKIEAAAKQLERVIHHFHLVSSRTFTEMTGNDIFMKCENQQRTGSFKVRGAYNKIKNVIKKDKATHVVAASAGNHAQGVAYSATKLGIKSTIVMPRTAPIAKKTATEDYGAKVILYGDCFDDAFEKALEIQKETKATFIHAFDDEDVIAGQGTIGLEILKDMPTVDAVLVPAGGGGLLAGVASAIKQLCPNVRIIGVQAENCSPLKTSFDTKVLTKAQTANTIADGIAVKAPGELTMGLINKYVDEIVTVTDSEIATAILLLLERSKQVVEPSGAVPIAAMLNNKVDIKGKKVVCVLSGGNVDVSTVNKIIERGLVMRGRLMRLRIILPDKTGSLQNVIKVISENNANIINIQCDRINTNLNLNEAIDYIVCEVAGFEHGKEIIKKLEKQGYNTVWEDAVL